MRRTLLRLACTHPLTPPTQSLVHTRTHDPTRATGWTQVRSPYGKAVDMWAVGCLMGELTDGEPMFAGDSDLDQLARIQRMQGRLTTAQEALFLQVRRAASRLFSAAPVALASALSQRATSTRRGVLLLTSLELRGAVANTHTTESSQRGV
jgi:serine/threonine protein kinase